MPWALYSMIGSARRLSRKQGAKTPYCVSMSNAFAYKLWKSNFDIFAIYISERETSEEVLITPIKNKITQMNPAPILKCSADNHIV
ncbi:MAG: hypothetical protein KGZ86_07810 [Candidatus Latescibacteria bacterium]|nr:hypothetical protein [Candidatus Latescibacterota bacterium]